MDTVEDAELFNSPLLRNLHDRLIIRPEIRRVQGLLGRHDFSMLDVGCGTGWISRIWADAGARITGLEPSETRANVARKRGLRVLSCYVEDLATTECYDLIVIRHVLEHLEEPKTVLRSLATRLNPGGIMLIVVPNIDCVGRYVFGVNWTWVLPWHCNFFNPRSLRIILQEIGLRVDVSYQTPSPLWYPQSFVSKFPSMEKFLRNNLLSMIIFAPLVFGGCMTRHGDNLTMMARSSRQ